MAGLLGHRTAGRWASTQENAFVLLALGRYFDTYESVTSDFTARLWLGEDFAGEQPFRGRSTDRRHLVVPMTALPAGAGGPRDLLLAKDGRRLYYRLGMRYAPASLAIEPLDRGFEVSRTYEALDDPADLRRDDDGTWHIRAGARVRVSLVMMAPARRYHVALVDPLPAGFEPLDPSLATTARDTAAGGSTVGVIGGPGLGVPGRGAGRATGGGGAGRGSIMRTCATTGPRHSPRSYGRVRTGTATPPARRPRAPSPPARPKPRKCTRPKCSAEARPTR